MFLVNWGLKYITQRIFRENKWNRFGTEDPYYEEYQVEQSNFFNGTKLKTLKRPREPPEGISPNDTSVLKQVMRRAYHLDMLFNVFGYRIGWSGLVGIVPFVGDVAGVVFSLLLFKSAREVDGGLPWDIQAQFLFNILMDFLLGLVPVVGDMIEVMYKANSRNALVLEKHLAEKGQMNIRKLTSTMSGTVESASDSISIRSKGSTPKKRSARSNSVASSYTVGKDPTRVDNLKQRNLDL